MHAALEAPWITYSLKPSSVQGKREKFLCSQAIATLRKVTDVGTLVGCA